MVCKRSGLKARAACLNTTIKEFDKGNVPPLCKVHIPPKIKPIRELHYGQRLFLWFIAEWRQDREAAMEKLWDTVIEIIKCQFSILDLFSWITDGKPEHDHLNGFTPFLKDKKTYHLKQRNPKYWDCAKDFMRVLKAAKGPDFQPTEFMRESYCGLPFQRSAEGIRRLISEEAVPIIGETTRWWIEAFREVYGPDYQPYIKPFNELSHRDSKTFWLNGRLHWAAVKAGLDRFVPLYHYNIDVSGSEGCQIFCNEPDKHRKLKGTKWENELIGYAEANRANWKQSILAENHGNCIAENLTDEKMNAILTGKWRRYKFSGDCGGGPNAKGYHIPGKDFRYASPAQYREFFRKLWTTAKDKGKRAYHCHVDFECFRNAKSGKWHLWDEDLSADNMDWELAAIPAKIHKEIYG